MLGTAPTPEIPDEQSETNLVPVSFGWLENNKGGPDGAKKNKVPTTPYWILKLTMATEISMAKILRGLFKANAAKAIMKLAGNLTKFEIELG